MKNSATLALMAAFVVSFLAVGMTYWRIPYSKASLPNSLCGVGLVVVLVAAAGCRCVAAARFGSAFLVVGASVPCTVMARVVYETGADPTSHNLWPIEVVIAGALGYSVSFVGSLVGGFLRAMFRNAGAGRGA